MKRVCLECNNKIARMDWDDRQRLCSTGCRILWRAKQVGAVRDWLERFVNDEDARRAVVALRRSLDHHAPISPPIECEVSSGNVFADLGLPNAGELLTRARQSLRGNHDALHGRSQYDGPEIPE